MTTTLVAIVLAEIVALPLAWKWELGVARAAAALVVLGALSGTVVAVVRTGISVSDAAATAFTACGALAGAAGTLLYRFYRNPDRHPPDREDVVVSPADGKVIYVRRAEGGLLPVSTKAGRRYALHELTRTGLHSGDATVIGIAMSFLDVHVNRAPLTGTVVVQRHFAGTFRSLKALDAVFENERATTVIDGRTSQVAVVQIASRLVRQIVSRVREGSEVRVGDRIGVIRFGSQVDLVLPVRPDLEVTTQVGDRLRAGESIVAVFQRVGPTAPVSPER